MKVLVLGASGSAGQRLVRKGLDDGHTLTVFVRDPDKLAGQLTGELPRELIVRRGDARNKTELAAAMQGQDVVINAAGNAMKTDGYVALLTGIIQVAQSALGHGGRLWVFGSSAALDVPGTDIMSVELPRMRAKLRIHQRVFAELQASNLDWSMLCPGPMKPGNDGKGHDEIFVSTDTWPIDRPAITRFLPNIALTLFYKRSMPDLTIRFEDAARIVFGHLQTNGPLSRKRIGVTLSRVSNNSIEFRSMSSAQGS